MDPMNSKARVIASLNHKQTDRVPYHIDFTKASHDRMVQFYGDPEFAEKLDNCLVRHVLCGISDRFSAIAPNTYEDEFGVQWDRTIDHDIGAVCNRRITPETLGGYEFPEAAEPSRYEGLDEMVTRNPDRFLCADVGFSLFERAWTLAGMEVVLAAMAAQPAFVHALLDRILEFNMRVIERACGYDIDAVCFGDDWGHQGGLMMGPRLWRELIKPRVHRMYRAVKEQGKNVFIHSCGRIQEVFPDLIECGLDVFNPFQPEVMDVFEMKRTYGRELSFWGGISTQKTLPYGTPQQTKDEVRALLDTIGDSGGYIAAPAHAIPADAKPENVAAMIDVLNDQ